MKKILLTLLVFAICQGADRFLYASLVDGASLDLYFCRFRLIWNQGIAFGWLSESRHLNEILLLLVISLVCGWVITKLYYLPKPTSKITGGWCLILGGGLSNLTHRATLGAIPDLINCHLLPSVIDQLYFNTSDLALVSGCGLLLLLLGRKQFS